MHFFSQALDTVLVARGYNKVEQKLSFYCIGDGKDLEVSLECDSQHVRRMPPTQVREGGDRNVAMA